MKRQLLLASLIVGSLAALTYAATPSTAALAPMGGGQWAHSPLGRMISGNFGRLLTLRSELNVTDEQREKAREVLKSHRSEIVTTVQSVRDARTNLRDLTLSDDATESEIRAAADALGKTIADAAVKRAELRKAIAPIFTAEQQHLVREFLADNDAAVDKFLAEAVSR